MRIIRVASLVVALGIIAVGLGTASCGGDAANASPVITSDTPAAAFRSTLNRILSDHVLLAAAATGAAAGGRTAEFTAAAGALDANSVELSDAIGSAYGADAGAAFLAGWRRHIGFFVDYTQGAAAKDAAKKQKAVDDLHQYAIDVATLLNAANGMPTEAVVALMNTHVAGFLAIIDAQVADDQVTAYAAIRKAGAHMHTIGDPLAEATVKKLPAKF